jgi:short-subunit dehydrogenase
MMSTTETKGTALITGASSGIGAIYANRLARRGYDLILVARNRSRLAALAQRLENETGRSVKTIAANLYDKADLARIETTLRTNASVTLLVNNAGVGATAPLLDSDVEKMDEMIRLNVGALTRLTYAAAPAEDMVDAALAGLDQGEIITIPSLPDKAEWEGFDAARRAMSSKLSSAVPARRYNIRHPQSAAA